MGLTILLIYTPCKYHAKGDSCLKSTYFFVLNSLGNKGRYLRKYNRVYSIFKVFCFPKTKNIMINGFVLYHIHEIKDMWTFSDFFQILQ